MLLFSQPGKQKQQPYCTTLSFLFWLLRKTFGLTSQYLQITLTFLRNSRKIMILELIVLTGCSFGRPISQRLSQTFLIDWFFFFFFLHRLGNCTWTFSLRFHRNLNTATYALHVFCNVLSFFVRSVARWHILLVAFKSPQCSCLGLACSEKNGEISDKITTRQDSPLKIVIPAHLMYTNERGKISSFGWIKPNTRWGSSCKGLFKTSLWLSSSRHA